MVLRTFGKGEVMRLLLLIFATMAGWGQTEVITAQKNASVGYQYIAFNDGTNITTLCKAISLQPTSPAISVASATNANPVVLTVSGGHGLSTNFRPLVTISGGTGNWTAINGTFTATPISTTTLSIAVNSTAFGALAGTVTFTTRSPRITQPVWSVAQYVYSGGIFVGSAWYGGSSSAMTTCSAAPSQYQ